MLSCTHHRNFKILHTNMMQLPNHATGNIVHGQGLSQLKLTPFSSQPYSMLARHVALLSIRHTGILTLALYMTGTVTNLTGAKMVEEANAIY